MAIRHQKDIYCFISDENGEYLRAHHLPTGEWNFTRSVEPYPIVYNPANLLKTQVEFGTNKKYFSLHRSVSYPLEFVHDGALILKHMYYLGKGNEEKAYITIIEWNGEVAQYELSYKGRIDFKKMEDDPKSGKFTVPTIDDSVWGILSERDNVEYAIDCSPTNPKAIPVLLDSITLLNKATFQPVQAALPLVIGANDTLIPFVLINQDGDSAGVVLKNQTGTQYNNFWTNSPGDPYLTSLESFFHSAYALTGVRISGSLSFTWTRNAGFPSCTIAFWFQTSKNQQFIIFANGFAFTGSGTYNLVPGKIYNIPFEFTFDLEPDERIFLVLRQVADGSGAQNFAVHPIVTNITIETETKAQPQIVWCLRPLDLLQDIVEKATDGKHTINSNHFAFNKYTVCTSGDAIRNIPHAKIFTSFWDFYKSFNSIQFLALRTINGELWIEKAVDVYAQNDNIIDLGQCVDIRIEPAEEMYYNEVIVGSDDQDLRHPSGRLEVNAENTFSFPFQHINKRLDLVSKYRTGCYDALFLALDYQGGSTQDNTGDKSVYILDITDGIKEAQDDVQTFENINVNNSTLEPIIKSPLPDEIITNDTPIIRGVANPSDTVNIYVDGVFDSTTTADPVTGEWSCQTVNPMSSYDPGVNDGVHLIQATFTDLIAPTYDVSIVINTLITTEVNITYPIPFGTLYNNTPLIKGVAQAGALVNIFIDGVSVGFLTADQSCKWEMRSPLLSNANHQIRAVVGSLLDSVNFRVDTNVAFPLITYVGSELDGFPLLNNLPLIKGVAQPGTNVTLWLNYISYVPLGTAIADANGNWQFQVVPVTYLEPTSGISVILAPIRNGLNVVSTGLINNVVGVGLVGYRLNRPNYTILTGVIDNTVFNTELSPKRMMMAWYPYFASLFQNQVVENIKFQKHTKNASQLTVFGGETIAESDDIRPSSLGTPLFLPEYVKVKTKTNKSFSKTLEDFNSGGMIKVNFRGTDIYALPIGSMRMNNITSEVQEWRLLLSPQTTHNQLMNLFQEGLTWTLMERRIYHSDYNTLHMVKYNHIQPNKYNFKELYEDWHENRGEAWAENPLYVQKHQRTDPLVDQVIVNKVDELVLHMYRCRDGIKIDTKEYLPVSPVVLATPEIVLEATFDMTDYPEDQYFFVMEGMSASGLIIGVVTTDPWIAEFFIMEDPNPGDKITASYTINASPTPVEFETTVQVGWNITDALTDLYNQILASGLFSIVTMPNGNTIHVEVPEEEEVSVVVTADTKTLIAISERIHTKDKWPGTILIEARGTNNKSNAYFYTGWKTILRLDGIVEKLKPERIAFSAQEESGDASLLYAQTLRKRRVRFGTAYGLPDYMYIRVANSLGLDECIIENVQYVLEDNEQIESSEDVPGHPLYYYEMILTPKLNEKGATFSAESIVQSGRNQSAVLNVDGTAFGLPRGVVKQIEIDNE